MKNFIKDIPAKFIFDQVLTELNNAYSTASAFGVKMDMKERQGRRKMGTARQGYANMILPIAISNVNALPRDKDPQRLSDLMDFYRNIALVRVQAMRFLELCDDTMKAVGIDAQAEVDSLASSLQNARKGDEGLDMVMGEIDAYNSRFGKQMEEEDVEDTAAGTDAGTTGSTTA